MLWFPPNNCQLIAYSDFLFGFAYTRESGGKGPMLLCGVVHFVFVLADIHVSGLSFKIVVSGHCSELYLIIYMMNFTQYTIMMSLMTVSV